MRSSTERIGAVFESWHAALGLAELSSAELLKRIAGGAQRTAKAKALADAIAALYPRSTVNAIKLGRWLASHRNVEASGLRLHGEHSSDRKLWRWSVEPVPTKAELAAFGDALVAAADERNEEIAAKARRGRTTLAAEVAAVVALDKAFTKRAARLATEAATLDEREERKRLRAEQKLEQLNAINSPKPAPPERAVTVITPSWGAFTTQRDADRLLKHFVRFTATARAVPHGAGFAITMDTGVLEETGKTFDALYEVAGHLMLEVKHERTAAPTSAADASFWPATAQYTPSLIETNPFALVEAEQKGRPVIPRGALKFNI